MKSGICHAPEFWGSLGSGFWLHFIAGKQTGQQVVGLGQRVWTSSLVPCYPQWTSVKPHPWILNPLCTQNLPGLRLAERPPFLPRQGFASCRHHLPLREISIPGSSWWLLIPVCCGSCEQIQVERCQVELGQDPPSGPVSCWSPKPFRLRARGPYHCLWDMGTEAFASVSAGVLVTFSPGHAYLLAMVGPFGMYIWMSPEVRPPRPSPSVCKGKAGAAGLDALQGLGTGHG